MSKVLITGISSIGSLGHSISEIWSKLGAPVSLPDIFLYHGPDDRFEKKAYKLKDLDKLACYDNTLGQASNYSIQCVLDALKDAHCTPKDVTAAGIVVGTAMGNILSVEDARSKMEAVRPSDTFNFDVCVDIANYLEMTGPSYSVSNACAASGYSISMAYDEIRQGRSQIMIAGGIDIGGRVVRGAFNRMGALDDLCCRPFDKNREGTVFSQGLSFLVLESEENFKQRKGEKVYGEIASHAWSCDGFHLTRPRTKGDIIESCVSDALQRASIAHNDIDVILPHATGTKLNDLVEISMLKRAFGDHFSDINIMSTKSHVGHSGGGSPAFAAVVAAKILETQSIPSSANYTITDPKCDVSENIVTSGYRKAGVNNILVNAYGFGGNNCSLVFSAIS